MPRHRPTATTYSCLIAATFLWGGTFIAGRMLAGQVPPLTASFLRFAIAGLSLLPLVFAIEGRLSLPTRGTAFPLLLLGFTGVFCYNYCFFNGLRMISASRAALIIATTPIAIAVSATVLYREPLSPSRIAGILFSLTGAFLVISKGHPSLLLAGGFGTGELWLLGCVASWTAYTMIGKTVLRSIPPLSCVFHAILAGIMFLILPAADEGLLQIIPTINRSGWSALFFLGIGGTTLGFSWYYQGLQRIGPGRSAVFINLVPLFAVIQAWLILGETVPASVFAGGVLVCTGVLLTNRPTHTP